MQCMFALLFHQVMLQPTEESSDRSKHKFMVQSMCLEGDVPLDELDATVSLDNQSKCSWSYFFFSVFTDTVN